MTSLTAYSALNMQDLSIWFGTVSSFSSTHITITAGLRSATYNGNFTYDAFNNVFGQLSSFEHRYDGSLSYEATGLNLDANQMMTLVQSGDALGALTYAFAKSDTLNGSGSGDVLFGFVAKDNLFGNGGNDRLTGGAGKDLLTGGAGRDKFDFNLSSESGKTKITADVVADFVRGQDKIDLATIDAFAATAANDAFAFVGRADFSDTTAGEIRFRKVDAEGTANDFTMVFIDTDGDIGAEMAIRLTGLYTLTASDFIL